MFYIVQYTRLLIQHPVCVIAKVLMQCQCVSELAIIVGRYNTHTNTTDVDKLVI